MSLPSLRVVSAPWDDPIGLFSPPAPVPAARAPRRRDLRPLLVTSDALASLTAAGLLGLLWIGAPSLAPGGAGLGARIALLLGAAASIVAVLTLRGSYASARRRLTPGVADELLALEAGVATAALLLLAATAVAPAAVPLPVAGIGVLAGVAAVLVPAYRTATLAIAARDGSRVSRVIVVGSGRVAGDLAARLARRPLVEVVGVVDDEPAGDLDVLGNVDDLPALCRAADADRVVIAFSRRHPSRSAELILALRDVVEVDVVVRYFELAGWESRLHDVGGLSLLNLGGRPGAVAAALKRALDLAVAATMLVVTAPLLAVVAVLVLASSGRPVFFRQRRVGRGEQTFRIVKFRTMRGEPAPRPAAPRTPFDPPDADRITAVGRVLRRTALDELPQLWNVLLGQMSLVGPRPFVPEECNGLVGWAHRRFDVRPGLTGMWQVCGQHEVSFDELCRLDVQYATSWSIRTDLRILARTPTRLLHGSAPDR